ncbi:senescence associated gene 20-like [Arachis stenosperma]|uniref:senescence associated gene 20-like n=1 Tax=Arachis stenosperma TaxID=217475 RepID=UPI0025ABB336|nr:senescence associated gene 20-like [Arachis stenosperma]
MRRERISGALPAAEQEDRNRKIVKSLYKALRGGGDTAKVEKIVGKEIEWWYHGPPHWHHMMKALTGKSTGDCFEFRPRRVKAIGDERVIVEGWEGVGEYWVHVWGLKQGIISQLREYFNTLVTVVVVVRVDEDGGGCKRQEEVRLWRTTSWVRARGSLPDLVLAI